MPIEALETEFPIIMVNKYSLRQDSGGAGKYRGGLGIHREFKMMREGISCKATGDRQVFAPYGLEGGLPGATGAFFRRIGDTKTQMPSKSTGNLMEKDELLIVLTPGAGGFGDPRKRNPKKVLNDVLDGYVSVKKAVEDYGVVIERDDNGFLCVNEMQTQQLRRS